MKVVDAIAHVLKAEGVEYLFAYPVNPIIEAAAKVDIRPIIVRQERIGIAMADAMSKLSSAEKIGVFCMQHGPGTENAFGGVAQSYGDSVPVLILPAGYGRQLTNVAPNFSALQNFTHVTKWCEQVTVADSVPKALRRAFTQLRNGHPRPVVVEFPVDMWNEEVPDFDYVPAPVARSAPDPATVKEVARVLIEAARPVLYAGQGVHYAKAWDELKALAEWLESPVTTSLEGKSAFPETHPLALGSGGRAISKQLHHFLMNAEVIFGIGCSFSLTNFGVDMPSGKTIIQNSIDSEDLNKDVPVQHVLMGDSKLTLQAVLAEVKAQLSAPRGRADAVAKEIAGIKEEWMSQWMPKLTSNETPLDPYRVIRDLLDTVDIDNTIITHDAGSPRDQITPFWESTKPLSYMGWGKTTQLGYGLGLAMGAKIACPDKLCINLWGDAAIGFTGMDFETAVRERIPIMSILLNNFCMAIELKVMPVSTEKFRSTDISGNYADMAKAFGGYGERVEKPEDIIPAIKRGIEQTQKGVPVLLEFITRKDEDFSLYQIS